MRVLVLHQTVDESRADEADTLLQAEEITAHLRALGHQAARAHAASLGEMETLLRREKPEAVFNLVESLNGADRFAYLAAGLLETMQTPFTGNSARALLLASDKLTLKALLQAKGIACPHGLEAGEDAHYIVKSVSEHASFGLDAHSVVSGAKAARQLIAAKTTQHGGEWLAEEYIEGREFNLALLETDRGMLLLPPAETVFEEFPEGAPHIVDYAAKWDENSHAYHHTPRRFGHSAESLQPLAQRVWDALALRGYARVDIRMDAAGKCWVIDVNPNPCLSADAGFMAAANEHGLTPRDVVRSTLENRVYAGSKHHPNAA